jgi:predicted DNA-binding protein with PD1-like motif
MRHKLLAEEAGERAFILVLDTGEEAFSSISTFANEQGIAAASVTAIGAFQSATIAFFEFETKEYRNIQVDEQSEALSLM